MTTSFQAQRLLDSVHSAGWQIMILPMHGENGFLAAQPNQEMATLSGNEARSSLFKPPLEFVAGQQST